MEGPAPEQMRVAIIHDWLNGMRGGEKVLDAILELYPRATIFTLFHKPGAVSLRIESHPIVTSWLNRLPGASRYYRNLLPLFPHAVESWNLSGFDLIISSSHSAAKGVRAENALHVCYCHTPMRYVWDAEDDYAFNGVHRAALRAIRSRLQRWDCEAAMRVDHFAANSRFVRERILEYYGRDAEVIHPPVDTGFFQPDPSQPRREFYLAAGALVSYKRFDLIIQAFKTLGRKLVIAGTGPDLARLRKLAGPAVEFRGWVTDEELRQLYRTAKGLLCAAREDFGIIPVEAQACGCPVIAFGAGGSLETVEDGINGVLFHEQHPDDIVWAVRRFETRLWPVDRVRCRVEAFSREIFQSRFRQFVSERVQEIAKGRKNFQPA